MVFGDHKTHVMGPAERSRISILLVEPDAGDRSNMRSCIKELGYGGVSDVKNHLAAFDKMGERHFTHIIFDARETNMPVTDFVKKVTEETPNMVLIPSSSEPDVDDVFSLFILGAKGYLVKPFTIDSLDEAIVNATKGEPIADVVLQAKDRNEALLAIMMQSIDVAAATILQSKQFETARREIPRAIDAMHRSAELVSMFAKGGEEGIMESMFKYFIERSSQPATRLGRLRRRLHAQH